MAETREEAIHRLERLWHRLNLLPDDVAKQELERFQLPTVLSHAEMAEINRAFLKHITPAQMIKVLEKVLPLMKP